MTGNQHQPQQQQKQKQELKQQIQNVEVKSYKCPNCGVAHTAADKFCPECGMHLKANACVRCGAATEANWEICPHCGQNLHAELCSFCGAKTSNNDAFCPECGNPKTGITCPGCQTLNFRSFCRKCNTPLSALAKEVLQQIRQKPELKKALTIAEELAALEGFFLSQSGEEAAPPEIPELSDENRTFVSQYKELLAVFREQKYEERTETLKSPVAEPKPRKTFSLNISGKEEAWAQYKAKLEEMKKILNSLIPDPGMTPQMQRDYYTAVKIEIITKTKVKVGWKCNAYGCVHEKPNDCAEPFKGGTWIFEDRDTSVWVRQEI